MGMKSGRSKPLPYVREYAKFVAKLKFSEMYIYNAAAEERLMSCKAAT